MRLETTYADATPDADSASSTQPGLDLNVLHTLGSMRSNRTIDHFEGDIAELIFFRLSFNV